LEKQQLVHNGKLKVQEEYAQKEKDLEIEQRVYAFVDFTHLHFVIIFLIFLHCFRWHIFFSARSAAVGASRIKKMKARDGLLEVCIVDC
jgi:hypothetical protein